MNKERVRLSFATFLITSHEIMKSKPSRVNEMNTRILIAQVFASTCFAITFWTTKAVNEYKKKQVAAASILGTFNAILLVKESSNILPVSRYASSGVKMRAKVNIMTSRLKMPSKLVFLSHESGANKSSRELLALRMSAASTLLSISCSDPLSLNS